MKSGIRRALGFAGIVLLTVGTFVATMLLLFSTPAQDPINTKQEVPFARLESPNTELPPPLMNLNGSYTAKNENGSSFEAIVADKNIKIKMVSSSGASMLYWNGTFETYQSFGKVVVSELMDDKAILSKSKSKDFTVGDGTLSFNFTAMGSTKAVVMSRV